MSDSSRPVLDAPGWAARRAAWLSVAVSVLLLVIATQVPVPALAATDRALALRTTYAALREPLRVNPYGRPLVIASTETPDRLTGNIHAVVPHAFDQVRRALSDPAHWCDVISLHINTKYCRAQSGPDGPMLRVFVGKKTPEELATASRVDFSYRVSANTPAYFDTVLLAKDGPLGTSDYRIALEAVAVPGDKTFIHLTYSYSYNFAGRLAMLAYLSTVGSDKVGFSRAPDAGSDSSALVGGMRGLVERNAMRYYLALDTYLEHDAPDQMNQRLQAWFRATEQYPRQLHEVDGAAYMAMKQAEFQRQQDVPN